MSNKSNAVSPIEPDFKHSPKLSLIKGKAPLSKEEILAKREFGKPVSQHLYDFTIILAAFFIILADVKLWKGESLLDAPILWISATMLLAVTYKLTPISLIPFWKAWLKLGAFLEVTTSYMLLGGMWFVMFIPISLLLKAIGKEPIKKGFRENIPSYWEVRPDEKDDMKLMERQF